MNHQSHTVDEALLKLKQFCAYRDRSQKEVEQKLQEMNMIPLAQEQIIIRLMQEGFLNEERYARSFVRGKFRIKKWGRLKIVQQLKQKGISKPIIKRALTEIEPEEYNKTLQELTQKKHVLLKEKNPYKKRQKLTRFLIQKGFESGLVYDMVAKLK